MSHHVTCALVQQETEKGDISTLREQLGAEKMAAKELRAELERTIATSQTNAELLLGANIQVTDLTAALEAAREDAAAEAATLRQKLAEGAATAKRLAEEGAAAEQRCGLATTRATEAEAGLTEFEAKLQTKSAECETAKASNNKLTLEVEAVRGELTELRLRLDCTVTTNETSHKVLSAQLSALAQMESGEYEQLDALKAKVRTLEPANQQLTAALSRATEARDAEMKRVEELRAQLSAESGARKISVAEAKELRDDVRQALVRISKMEHDRAEVEAMSQKELEALRQAAAAAELRAGSLDSSLAASRDGVSALRRANEALEAKEADKQAAIEGLGREKAALETRLASSEAECSNIQRKHTALV
eukprot:SAG11_NODE_7078_length_1198_cov_0.800728_1_plen_364_part_01